MDAASQISRAKRRGLHSSGERGGGQSTAKGEPWILLAAMRKQCTLGTMLGGVLPRGAVPCNARSGRAGWRRARAIQTASDIGLGSSGGTRCLRSPAFPRTTDQSSSTGQRAGPRRSPVTWGQPPSSGPALESRVGDVQGRPCCRVRGLAQAELEAASGRPARWCTGGETRRAWVAWSVGAVHGISLPRDNRAAASADGLSSRHPAQPALE